MSRYKELLKEFKNTAKSVRILIDQYPKNKRGVLLFDKWSLKDVVAHLNHWMDHDIDCLEHLLKGVEPYWEPDVEEFNRNGVDSRKNKSWEEIHSEFNTLTNKLISVYENLPEELHDRKIWRDKSETPISFLYEDINHWKNEHIPFLSKMLKF